MTTNLLSKIHRPYRNITHTAIILIAHLSIFSIHHAQAQEPEKANVLEKIFTLRDPNMFTKAMEEAKQSGVHPQALLEAKFLFLVDTGTNAQIAALTEEMKQLKETFSLKHSQIFSVKEDWLAVVHYTQALAALEQNDRTAFRAHITEAFWLSPRQASAYAPHIEQLHLDDAMTKIQLKPEHSFLYHTKEGSTTLQEILTDKKAALLYFWSPWSREVETTFSDFKALAKLCEQHNITTLAIHSDTNPESMLDAKSFIESQQTTIAFEWIIDQQEQPLAQMMRVQRHPTIVLLSTEGYVLYNGTLDNKQLWIELKEISPELIKPESLE